MGRSGSSRFCSFVRTAVIVQVTAVTLCIVACAKDSNDGRSPSSGGTGAASSGGDGGRGGDAARGGGSTIIDVGDPPAGGQPGSGGACAGSTIKGEPIPLDIYVMLDSSDSMAELVDADTSKWDAVKQSLSDFIHDEASAGLGVGIQYFPLDSSAIPTSCTHHTDCGDGGECISKYCRDLYLEHGAFLACAGDFFCPTGPCISLAHCADEPARVCTQADVACAGGSGTCTAAASSMCAYAASCDAADYAAAAKEIAELPEGASALITSLDERQLHGDTPTAAALAGVIEHASSWAEAHPDHAVVALLATDGLPTQCDEQTIEGIAALAQAGVDGSPSIPTYVIGVFAPAEVDAEANLDIIAEAGGTIEAFMVDTEQNVAGQFLKALEAIRGTRLVCEFTIPDAPPGETLDFGKVNVQLSAPSGVTTFPYVASLEGCGDDGGWYYDADTALSAPTRIISCPATCAVFEAANGGEVQIELGCETITTVVK